MADETRGSRHRVWFWAGFGFRGLAYWLAWFRGLGFRGLGCRGLGSRGLGFRVLGGLGASGAGVRESGFRSLGLECCSGSGVRIPEALGSENTSGLLLLARGQSFQAGVLGESFVSFGSVSSISGPLSRQPETPELGIRWR